jgi:hypothetical protein
LTPPSLPCPAESSSRIGSGTVAGTEQSHHASQALPSRLIQRRLRAHQITDHVPGRHVQRPLRRHPHRQRYRALGTKANPLRPGLLPRLYSDSLREHVYRDGLVSCLNFAPAAQTNDWLHGLLPDDLLSARNTFTLSQPLPISKYEERFLADPLPPADSSTKSRAIQHPAPPRLQVSATFLLDSRKVICYTL